MKRILITGKNSYIGMSLEEKLRDKKGSYLIDTIDMKNAAWKEISFSSYDVVLHVAGIAHIQENKQNQNLYYKINRDLAFETAKKAKLDGVKQFIFLSSMSIYGVESGEINSQTKVNPKTAYGKSKLEAEQLLARLDDSFFSVAILRPPMVYGKGCKGNYPRLVKLALKTPVFPKVDNKRSMIFIDNLTEFLKLLIDNSERGLFFPQNAEYVNTSDMVSLIAKVHGKKVLMTKLFNPILKIGSISIINKVFGSLTYDMSLSEYPEDYRKYDLESSIIKTEGEMLYEHNL